jgi:hypothetical protein
MISDMDTNYAEKPLSITLVHDLSIVLSNCFADTTSPQAALVQALHFYQGRDVPWKDDAGIRSAFHTSYHVKLCGGCLNDLSVLSLGLEAGQITSKPFDTVQNTGFFAFLDRTIWQFYKRNGACQQWFIYVGALIFCYVAAAYTLAGKTIVRFRHFALHSRFLTLVGISYALFLFIWCAWVWNSPSDGRSWLLPVGLAFGAPTFLTTAERQLQRLNLPINVALVANFLNVIAEGTVAEIQTTDQGAEIMSTIRSNSSHDLAIACRRLLASRDLKSADANKFAIWLNDGIKRVESLADKTVTETEYVDVYGRFVAEMLIYKYSFNWKRINDALARLGIDVQIARDMLPGQVLH